MPDVFNIVGNIVTTLAAINTATTPTGSTRAYRTTVALAERGIRTWEEVKPSERPYLGVARVSTDFDNELNGVYDTLHLIKICGHVTGGTPAARDEAIDNLLNDVKAALHVDARRGGIATFTKLRRAITDEADPIQRVHGSFELTIAVESQEDFKVEP